MEIHLDAEWKVDQESFPSGSAFTERILPSWNNRDQTYSPTWCSQKTDKINEITLWKTLGKEEKWSLIDRKQVRQALWFPQRSALRVSRLSAGRGPRSSLADSLNWRTAERLGTQGSQSSQDTVPGREDTENLQKAPLNIQQRTDNSCEETTWGRRKISSKRVS